MGGGICSCCDLTTTKAQEISIMSPKGKLSLLGFQSFQSPKNFSPELELQQRIKTLENLINFVTLRLKVINSGNIQKGTLFLIKPQGLDDSLREKKDGYTYFGCKRKLGNEVINDIVIPLSDKELTTTQQGQNFLIYYNIEKNSYWIKDLGKGYSAFIKINHPTVNET
jgi:hypothetical protein